MKTNLQEGCSTHIYFVIQYLQRSETSLDNHREIRRDHFQDCMQEYNHR